MVLDVGAEGVQHLDALGVLGRDDGGDVVVGGSSEAAKAHLAQHAWHIGAVGIVRVEVADPRRWEGLVGRAVGREGERLDCLEPGVGREDYVLVLGGLVDELHEVLGRCHGCERGGCEKDSVDELHLENLLVPKS